MSESSIPKFQGFPKIPRLNRDMIITEKIDGTNAQVYIGEGGQVWAGSRKRWLTIHDDNYGFAAWVYSYAEELRQLGPGHHFGEWWGKGIQRNYGLDHRRFSLFNVIRWRDPRQIVDPVRLILSDEAKVKRMIVPDCCRTVPVIRVAPFSQSRIDLALECLRLYGSQATAFDKPEGIIIYHTAGNHLYKVTLEGDEKPKEKK